MRSTLAMGGCLVLLLTSCSARGEERRPPGAAQGPAVADLVVVRGKGQVRSAGAVFPAKEGLPLTAADELLVPVAGLMVVSLRNGHLVTVDEDLELRVSDIALLKSNATAPSFEQQLAALQRRHTLQGNEGERVAGFQSRRMAGRTVGAGVEREEEAAPSPKAGGVGVARKALQEPRAGAPASVASASPPPSPAPAPSTAKDSPAESMPKAKREVSESKKAVARSADKEVASEREKAEPPEEAPAPVLRRWGRWVKGQPRYQASALPAPLAGGLSALESCLRSDAGLRALGLGKVPVLLRLEQGKVVRAVLGQGLPTPACLVVDAAVPGELDGWLVIEANLE